MFDLSEAAVRVVGADSRTAIKECDTAYAASLRLAANTVEVLQDANVAAGQSQRLFRTLSDAHLQIIDSRSKLISAIDQLRIIHRHSNQAETDAGCPWWTTPTGKAEETAAEPAKPVRTSEMA